MKPIRAAFCALARRLPLRRCLPALAAFLVPVATLAQAPDGAVVPNPARAQLTGAALVNGASIPLTYIAGAERSRKITNVVTLSVIEESPAYAADDFTDTVIVRIDYGASSTQTNPQQQTFVVNYKKGAGLSYSAKNYLSFSDAAYVNVTVLHVYAPTLSNGVDTRTLLSLQNEMRVRQYFELDTTNTLQPAVTVSTPAVSPVPDELPLSWTWPLSAGANQTQLEWTWLESELASNYTNPDGSVNYTKLFRSNSTRVDLPVGANAYRIPLFYDGVGTLYYRLRAVNIKASGSRSTGPWSAVGAYGYHDNFNGHNDSLNWQASTAFAEEGKRKSVMQYFDGSLRMRQTVTKDNSTATTVSAETFYDGQGRAAIQILPAPGINTIVQYTHNLNLFNGQSAGQDPAAVFDLQPLAGVADTLPPLLATSGTARYYSPSNPEITGSDANSRLPDARGYPYTVTRYTPDGSGRIGSQSAPGQALAAGKGRETKYYYGNAAQEELNGLFGTEAGYASHYFKNMVQDANGQMSVSYTDMHGRTIATALAGDALNGMTALDLSQYPGQSGNTLTRNLLGQNTNLVKGAGSVESFTSLLVPFSTAYQFSYTLNPPSLKLPACSTANGVCYRARYDLEITITDESGEHAPRVRRFTNVATATPNSCPVAAVPLADLHYDTKETSVITGNNIRFSDTLSAGSYTIRKTLVINDSTLQQLRDQYMKIGLCDTVLQQVVDSVKGVLLPSSSCGVAPSPLPPCQACVAALGAYPAFRSNYLSGLDTLNNKPPETEIHQAYSRDSAQCAGLCDTSSHRLDMTRQLMLADMMPFTGQYAKDPATITSPGTMYQKYDIFSTTGGGQHPFYKSPQSGSYYDLNGAIDQSILQSPGLSNTSPQRFDSLFVPSWATSLLPYHPEYARLQFATQQLKNAYDWIERFNQSGGYQAAVSAGFNNNAGTIETLDPFFTVASGYQSKMNQLETGSNGSAPRWYSGETIWQMAYSNVVCGSYSDAQTRNSCYANAPKQPPFSGVTSDQADQIWEVFKGLYGTVRDSMVNDFILTSVPLADTGDLVRQGYILRFAASTSQQVTQYQWNGFPTQAGTAPAVPVSSGVATDRTSRCSSYIDHWKQSLLQCPTLAAMSNKDQVLSDITAAMEAVCEKGQDESNPYGASNIAPNAPHSGADTSFEQAITRIFGIYHINIDQLCNPFVIDYPKPYSKGPVFTKEVMGTVDSCACKQFAAISQAAAQAGYTPSNLSSLNQYLNLKYQDTLTPVLFAGMQHCSVLGTTVGDCHLDWSIAKGICNPGVKGSCTTPPSNATVTPTPGVALGSIGAPPVACNTTDTCTLVFQSQNCDTIWSYTLDSPQPKPAFLQCGFTGAGRCLTCAQLSAYISGYKQYFNGMSCAAAPVVSAAEPNDTTVGYNAAFARYVNYKSGLQLTWIDYVNAASAVSCNLATYASNGSALQTVVCGDSHPLNDTTGVLTAASSPCQKVYNNAVDLATAIYEQRKQQLLADFESNYRNTCLTAKDSEQFTVQYSVKEYHYTLYYYDMAGNLVKTVPPKGVVPAFDTGFVNQVSRARAAGNSLLPSHLLTSDYRYNSLNMVVTQRTPDAGVDSFWYDRIGRLAVSRNAQQRADGKYSYTIYDPIGRITEVGQKPQGTAMSQAISQDSAALRNWIVTTGGTREQITATVYDTAVGFGTNPLLTQQNLRNRVSYTYTKNFATDPAWYMVSYYTYDIHGNVDTLLQDYTGVTAMSGTGNRYKRICYQYDLISGKVNGVDYQPGSYDAFYHRYHYDAENRLTDVQTSRDSIVWEYDATYNYYKHGPLSGTKLGQLQVQAMDYSYTLQGWLKGVGIGKWGSPGAANNTGAIIAGLTQGFPVSQDAYSFSLHYYTGDYSPVGSNTNGTHTTSILEALPGVSLYNGNIAAMAVNLPSVGAPRVYNYHYDQLNRLKSMDAFSGINLSTGAFTPVQLDDYKERVSYDPNGNILSYTRHGYQDGTHSTPMDSLTYHYPANKNQLDYLDDGVTVNNYATDIKSGQSAGNYTYDLHGNLVKDNAESLNNITWSVYGKILEIQRTATASNPNTDLLYTYDPAGNRITKMVNNANTSVYVRDATGNVISVYQQNPGPITLHQTETYIYGSTRVGLVHEPTVTSQSITLTGGAIATLSTFTRGEKQYELSNHLGNVLAAISDRRIAAPSSGTNTLVDHYTTDISSAQDYYPFGMQMPGRIDSATAAQKYRYGFNGKENDRDVKGDGNEYDYGFRIYDPRIGRFLSVDPLFKTYPWYTPYQFAGNKPIIAIDLDGLEEKEELIGYWNDPKIQKQAAGLASTDPQALAVLQRASWNQIVVDVENIVRKYFDPNKNMDQEAVGKVYNQLNVYLGSDAVTRYVSLVDYNNTKSLDVIQLLRQKAEDVYNDHFWSSAFGSIYYKRDLATIDEAKDPNDKAQLMAQRHERNDANRNVIFLTLTSSIELYGGFMTMGTTGLGPSLAPKMELTFDERAPSLGDWTKVGRWMSEKEYSLMQNTGRVQEGSGGVTFASVAGPDDYRATAAPGTIYVEYEVPTKSLLGGGSSTWVKNVGPGANSTMKIMLKKQGGEMLPEVRNLSPVIEKKQ